MCFMYKVINSVLTSCKKKKKQDFLLLNSVITSWKQDFLLLMFEQITCECPNRFLLNCCIECWHVPSNLGPFSFLFVGLFERQREKVIDSDGALIHWFTPKCLRWLSYTRSRSQNHNTWVAATQLLELAPLPSWVCAYGKLDWGVRAEAWTQALR